MRKISLLLVFLGFIGLQVIFAQTRQITGTVTSGDDGTSIPGVSVVVKGSTLGTITDMDGKFSLKVPQGAKALSVSFVGMTSAEVPLTSASNYKVVLKSETVSVDEVIVTAMGIKRKPKEMGVATAKVDNQELTAAGASNVMNGMAAKVSGLQINTINNGVNPETKITLRGNRHFLASNQALVVLDGVPVSATYLNSINPNDIADVNILKGSSAAALYGNDASNGVMIVTTKKGENGKLTVKISNITTFEQISYLPNMQTRFGSGSGETIYNSDPNYTMWIGPGRNTDPYTSYENQTYGPEFNGQMVILGGKLVDGSYQMVPYSAIKNQKRDFFNTGVTMQNDISVSGGDDKSHFYLSAQDVKSTGTIPDDTNRRTGARMAAGRKYGMFSADYSISFTRTSTSTSGGDMYQGRGVYWNVLNTPPHVPLTKYKDIVNNPFAALDGYFNAYYPNPYWQIKHARNNQLRNDVLGSVNLNLKPTKWLELANRSGIVYNGTNNHNYKDEAIYSSYSKSDPWSQGHMGVGSPYAGNSSDQMRNSIILTNDFTATVDHKIGLVSLKAVVGNSIYSNYYESSYDAANGGLVVPGLYNISNRIGEAAVSQSTQKRNSIGVFADFTVGYKDYAFIHFSGRNDWDSRLTKANRSFFYPAADASLILSQMFPSIIGNNVLSFLKVRGGWSQTGQISLGDWYGTLPQYYPAGGFPYGSTAGFSLSTTLSNPLIKPEKTNETELGVEMSFLKNKIHLETNVYQTKTLDQTIPAQISASTGYYSALINAGELDNKGLEVDLKFTPLLNLGQVTWNASVNYSYLESKVVSIFPGLDEIQIADASYVKVGQQFPAIKVSDVKRTPTGQIIVDPNTGQPVKDPALQQVGHGNPNHILGISTDLNYKGFRLSATAEYRGGNVIVNAVGNALDFTGVSEHSAQNGRQPFVIPNSVIQTSPGVYTPNTSVLIRDASRNFWVNSDYHNVQRTYTTSAAFWKLREVALSYDIPVKKLFGGNTIQDAQVALIGRNLIMLRPKSNVWTDPEFNTQAPTNNAVGYTTEDQTPPTRVYGFSVKLTF